MNKLNSVYWVCCIGVIIWTTFELEANTPVGKENDLGSPQVISGYIRFSF